MSVIYKIKNLKTKKVYVGSTTQPERRKSQHFVALRSDSHHNYKLQADFKKYGEENFSFYVVEDLGVVGTRVLLRKEEEYIAKQKSPYNIELKPYSNPYKPSKAQSKELKKKKRQFNQRKRRVVKEMTKDLPVNPTHNEKIRYHLDALKELGVKLKVSD